MPGHRIFATSFSSIYPHYVAKAERRGSNKDEVDAVIAWLTGYDAADLEKVLADGTDLETFFAEAPSYNVNAPLITGVICCIRVEEIEDPLMKKVRQLDKVVDGLGKKKMSAILRGGTSSSPA
jgi:hypothetical protein